MVAKPMNKVFSFLFLFFLSFFLFTAKGFTSPSPPSLIKLPPGYHPHFVDNGPATTLKIAISNSLNYLNKLPSERKFQYGEFQYSVGQVKESLNLFKSLVHAAGTSAELYRLINQYFDIFQAGSGRKNEVLVTGYYEPVLRGSVNRIWPYLYPLYKRPDDLIVRQDAEGERRIGRYDNGYFLPYWSRADIENNKYLVGQELVYLASPVDSFFLHVQGSGRILFPNGKIQQINYAAKNGHPYRSIGKYLVEQGIMQLEDVSMQSIRCYLEENKEECRKILQHNPSYIFFKWGENGQAGPMGCLGEPLTPMRSIALDQKQYPPGALAFLQTWEPQFDAYGKIIGWQPLSIFVLNQDSGSAIKGPGRVDLFWGNGERAETAAGNMKHAGNLYFLAKKRK